MARGRVALLVGAGGLYLRGVVDNLAFPGTAPDVRALLQAEVTALGPRALFERLAAFDPEAARRIEPSNARRTIRALEVAALTGRAFSEHATALGRYPAGAFRGAGVEVERMALHRRIERRVLGMMPALLEETRDLLERGSGPFLTSSQAIGYAEAIACVQGRISEAEAVAGTIRRTKALARRQMAWLRRDPRIRWFPAGDEGAVGVLDNLSDWLHRGGQRQGAGSAAGTEA
jgi:tRNA dimethylallyltransferase